MIDIDQAENQEVKSLLYSTVFRGVQSVILDTTDVLIGSIRKIGACDHGIFVLDPQQTKTLYLFTHEGVFVRKVGGRGRGPGEYETPNDFTIDEANQVVYVLDSDRQRINKYDIGSGKYLDGIDINRDEDQSVRSYHIQCVDGSLFADVYGFTEDACLLQKIDPVTGQREASLFNAIEYNKGWCDFSYIHDNVFTPIQGSSARFVQQFMDTVMYLGAKEVKPYLVIKSDHLMSAKEIQSIDPHEKLQLKIPELFKKNKIFNLSDYIERNGFIFLRYMNGFSSQTLLYDIRAQKTQRIKLTDDLLYAKNSKTWMPQFGCATDQGVYYYVNNEPFTSIRASAEGGLLAPDLDQLDRLKTLNDNANPVIFFYEYKP